MYKKKLNDLLLIFCHLNNYVCACTPTGAGPDQRHRELGPLLIKYFHQGFFNI